MSELKANNTFVFGEECLAYKKSEADKLIADLEESHKKEIGQLLIEIKRLENLCASYRHDCDNLAIREANALKEIGRDNRVIRHQKYKRCLDNAWWCRIHDEFTQLESERLGLPHHTLFLEYRSKAMWWNKWQKRWLKLAEQFKEDK